MLRFLGGVVVLVVVLGAFGVRIKIDTSEAEQKASAFVDQTANELKKQKEDSYQKFIAQKAEAEKITEQDRQQTVSENPADNGQPVPRDAYDAVMNTNK